MTTHTTARPRKRTIVRSFAALHTLVALPDGTRLRVRAIRPDGEPRLAAMFGRLSARSVSQRFLTVRGFPAEVLAENRPMLRMIWRLGEIHRRELAVAS